MINQAENEGLGNHSESNLQLEFEHNLKSNNIIDIELSVKSETESFLSITRKFLYIKVLILKKNRLDDEEIDIFNLKYVCVLMVYIIELENKVESVYYVDIRILILKIYQEVINDPVFAEKWKDVINLELRTLISNFIWIEIVLLKDTNFILNRWIFDIKYILIGKMEYFKVRLIARGFLQIHRVDYGEIFVFTVYTDSIRLLFILVIINDWKIY